MSWLADRTGIHLGNVGGPIGAAIGSVIPGVGTSLGAALGQGLGAMGQGKSLGQAALQGAGAYGVGKLASPLLKKLPLPGKLGSALGGALGVSPGAPAPQPGSDSIPYIPGGAGNVGELPGSAAPPPPGGNPTQGVMGGIMGADKGLSTIDKWQLGLQGLGGIAGGVGQYMNAQANQNIAANQLAEQQRQFNIPQQMHISQQLATSPLRDQAAFMLSHRMMQTPQQFQGGGIGGPGQGGGVDMNASAARAAQYTPGAGGQGENDALLRQLLASMGAQR